MARTKEEKAAYGRAWRAAHPGYRGPNSRTKRQFDPKARATQSEYDRQRRAAETATPEGRLMCSLRAAKARARVKGLPFDLTVEDIEMPEFCPVLGFRLEPSPTGHPWDASPSLDKIRPELGYVRGNVRVISHLANKIKGNCTDPEVFRKVAAYVEWELLISPLAPP